MLTDTQKTLLKDHHLAVLATGRSDGSPQVSTVMYDYDGIDIAISIKRFTAKWKNVLRQSKIGLVINDGRTGARVLRSVRPRRRIGENGRASALWPAIEVA